MLESFKKLPPFKREDTKTLLQREQSHQPDAQWQRHTPQAFGQLFDSAGSGLQPQWKESGWDGWLGDFSPSSFSPVNDIADEQKYLKITADLPRLDAADTEVKLLANALGIRGQKRVAESLQDKSYYRSERSYAFFEGLVLLPAQGDDDRTESVFDKGVLSIRLPKRPEVQEQAKRIAAKGGQGLHPVGSARPPCARRCRRSMRQP